MFDAVWEVPEKYMANSCTFHPAIDNSVEWIFNKFQNFTLNKVN